MKSLFLSILSVQITIFHQPKKKIPEIRNIPYYSLAFGVTSAEVAIIFPRYLQTQVEIQSTWDLRKGTEQFPTATICEGILEILYQVGEPHHN